LVWETTDPRGRRIILTKERWLHIVARHPVLEELRDAVLQAAARPTRTTAVKYEHEEWFYGRGAGPTKWLKVSVHYEGDEGHIVTAFPRRAFP